MRFIVRLVTAAVAWFVRLEFGAGIRDEGSEIRDQGHGLAGDAKRSAPLRVAANRFLRPSTLDPQPSTFFVAVRHPTVAGDCFLRR